MKTMMMAAALFVASVLPAFSATEKEEEFASRSAAILMLAVDKCDLSTFDVSKMLDQIDAVYDTAGVNPDDYPKGEWTRKIFFTISQTDYLRKIQNGEPQMVNPFCKSIREKFPNN